MNPKEASEILRICANTLKRMVKRGELSGTKVKPTGRGGHWRWDITQESINKLLTKYESQ